MLWWLVALLFWLSIAPVLPTQVLWPDRSLRNCLALQILVFHTHKIAISFMLLRRKESLSCVWQTTHLAVSLHTLTLSKVWTEELFQAAVFFTVFIYLLSSYPKSDFCLSNYKYFVLSFEHLGYNQAFIPC